MEKGKLIYKTRLPPLMTFENLLLLILICYPFYIVTLWIVLFKTHILWIQILLFIVMSGMFSMLIVRADFWVYRNFRIYENGITKPIAFHIKRLFNIKGRFIPFSQIKGYEKITIGQLNLKLKKEDLYRGYEENFHKHILCFHTEETIKKLIRTLKENNIPEFEIDKKKCGIENTPEVEVT